MSDMLGPRKYESAKLELRYTQALPYELRQLVREVFNVKTDDDKIGLGYGTHLMHQVCDEADKYKKVLLLIPDSGKLETWYSKFGFNKVQDKPVVLMIRNPKGL